MPVTAILVGISVAGMVTTTIAAHNTAEAQAEAGEHAKEASDSLADLADYNAGVARLQAKDAVARGAEEESRFRAQIGGAIGAQRAGIAAGNIDVSYGSAVDVQADAAFLGELDALTIRNNAAREAWGYTVQAADLDKRAEISRKTGVYQEAAGRQAATATNVAAVGTILGGTSALLQRYGFSKA